MPIPIPAVSPNEAGVGVWVLSPDDRREDAGWKVITRGERERADRLVREEDRTLWIHTRALLRRILAEYLLVEPQLIVFGEGPKGKPEVCEPTSNGRLDFSVSHSGGLAVITVARDRRVGVDVERIQPDLSWEPIAENFFSASDIAFIEGRPASERCLAFFDCWVRKESYLKGLGVGLSKALDDFFIPMGSVVGVVEDAQEHVLPGSEGWRVYSIHVPDGYAAALAVEGACEFTTVRVRGSGDS